MRWHAEQEFGFPYCCHGSAGKVYFLVTMFEFPKEIIFLCWNIVMLCPINDFIETKLQLSLNRVYIFTSTWHIKIYK